MAEKKKENQETILPVTEPTGEETYRNIADTETNTEKPIVDIHEAAEERVKKNEAQIARNEELNKLLEAEREDHAEQLKRFNDNVK